MFSLTPVFSDGIRLIDSVCQTYVLLGSEAEGIREMIYEYTRLES
jgi:hypothetical protein